MKISPWTVVLVFLVGLLPCGLTAESASPQVVRSDKAPKPARSPKYKRKRPAKSTAKPAPIEARRHIGSTDVDEISTDGHTVRVTVQKRLRLCAGSDAFYLSRSGRSLAGFAPGGGAQYALSSPLAIRAAVHQGIATSDGVFGLFTTVELGITYAVTGSLLMQDQLSVNGGNEPRQFTNGSPGGLRAGLSVHEYFFSASSSAPLPGLGVSTQYEFPSSGALNFWAGLRGDFITGRGVTLFPVRLQAGIFLWL